MRVGIYTFRIGAKPTGLANYAINLTRAMRRIDPSVEIVLLTPYETAPNDWYTELPTHFVGMPVRSGGWSSVPVAPIQLRRAVRQLGLDVVHAPANVAPYVARGGGAAWVATVHDLAPLTHAGEHRVLSRAAYAVSMPLLRWTTDAVITVSEQSRQELIKIARIPGDKIFVTPNGVELPPDKKLVELKAQGIPELGLGPDDRFVLFVGDVRPRKNLSRIIEAFRSVRQKYPELRLVAAGQDMHRSAEIDRQLAALNDAVIRPGYVDEGMLERLYANAVCVMLPSLTEGFGLPALEAMAHGTVPVVSTLPVLVDVVGDAGLAVDPFSTNAIAGAMISLVGDEELRRSLGDRGRIRAGGYSWDNTSRLTLEVYNRLVAERKS